MTPERWEVIKTVFSEAVGRDTPERERLLAERCGADAALREEIERLLASHAAGGGFLDRSPLPGAAALAAHGRFTGSTRGHYRFGRRVASGGMGEVYEATDGRTGDRVAIKVLTDDGVDAGERLKREAGHASELGHPNICEVFDVAEDEAGAYIAMEFLDGAPLHDAVPADGLDPSTALGIAVQLASAIGHAHDRRIVHRDLKSANVMLLTDGRVKVLDFGLARRLPQDVRSAVSAASLSGTGVIAGTLSYLAPEVLKGERADSRSDVWAFGIVLHELLTGRQPFAGHTAFELTSEVLTAPPPALPSRVPGGLRTIRDNCLAKNPAERYQNGGELLSALRSCQSGARVPRRVKPRRAWRAAAAVALPAILAVAAAVRLLPSGRRAPDAHRPPTVAVLPFRDVSVGTGEDYFGDGVTESVIDRLGTTGTVRVYSYQSVRHLREPVSIAAIRSSLPADAIVRGTVEQTAGLVRMNAELLDAATERTLWREAYERPANEILAIENLAARAVADRLGVRPSEARQSTMSAVRAVDPVVYEAYLKGRFQWNRRTNGSLERAVEFFSSALERDPTYAPAHAALADCYNQLGTVLVGTASPVDMRPRAKAEAIAAIQIDDALAEAHATLAYISHYEWNWAVAEREFRRAFELNPNMALARAWYSNYLISRGRPAEAVEQVRLAEELDPFSLVVVTNVGWTLSNARRPQEAIAAYRRALALDPGYVQARMRLGAELANTGRFAEAIEEHLGVVDMTHRSPAAVASLAQTFAKAGRRDDARTLLAELLRMSGRQFVSPVNVYLTYFLLGDRDSGFAWMDRAFQERSNGLAYLMVEPSLDGVRADPRLRRAARQVGLPE